VLPQPGQSFDRALQFQQGEGGSHQFKHHRPVFQLAAQPRDGGGENPAMVEQHGRAQAFFLARALFHILAAVAIEFLHQPGFI